MTLPRYEGLDALRVVASFGVVFLHVFVAAGYPSALWLFVKFRDFALPVMVMSSFFVLTISLTGKPGGNFGSFFSRRLKRLWIPLIVWTLIYSLTEAFLFPALLGSETFGGLPLAAVFFTGYRHLWFLQFIFAGSLLIYPLVKRVTGKGKSPPLKLSGFCFGATFLYGFLFWSSLKNYTDWDNFNPEADENLKFFISQAGNYILYIPVAVGLALGRGKISDLFARAPFRHASLALVLITMTIHVGTNGILWTREIYAVAVFLAALQPWRKIPSRLWNTLAAYSYGIYILHFLPAQLVWLFVAYKNFEPSGAAVFGISIIVYLASFAAAVLIRKLLPADWLLPLVPVSLEPAKRKAPAKKNSFAPPLLVVSENAGEK